MVTLLSFVGTRPELIKMLAFTRAVSRIRGIRFLVMFTGQNYQREMSESLWKELKIPIERANRIREYGSVGVFSQSILDFIWSALQDYKPDAVLSNTDTDTAFYTAWMAAKAGFPIAHIEGGIRCEARNNPEEINRRLADHLATWIFPIGPEDRRSLIQEGFSASQIFLLGDITLDALNIVLKEHRIPVESGSYDMLTIHRIENTDHPRRLVSIFEGIRRAGRRTLFPIHPRMQNILGRNSETRKALEEAANIMVLPPQSYLNMVRLVAGCRKVISDSGGLRREGYMLGKPVISLVWFVWFKRMNRLGYECVVDADSRALTRAIQLFNPSGSRPPLFGDGHAAERILYRLKELVSGSEK